MIVTLTGPSCAGKSTLENMLVERGLAKAISTTSRPMRRGDVDGESYYFVTVEEFMNMANSDELVEEVTFDGNCYGLSVAEVERLTDLGKPIVVVCEPIGQKQIAAFCKARGWPIYAVFVDNPVSVITERFLGRFAQESAFEQKEAVDKAVATYSGRLKQMMTTERGWIAEAWGSEIYNLRLGEFCEINCEEVADIIADVACGRRSRAA